MASGRVPKTQRVFSFFMEIEPIRSYFRGEVPLLQLILPPQGALITELFYCDRFGQVSRLVYIGAFHQRYVVAEEL